MEQNIPGGLVAVTLRFTPEEIAGFEVLAIREKMSLEVFLRYACIWTGRKKLLRSMPYIDGRKR